MKEEVLLELGMSKNEAKIYLSLLNLGSSTTTNIIKDCRLNRSNVYDALNSLTEKGLVAYILKKDIKYFEVTHPENLLNIIKEKEIQLSNILPQLLLKEKDVKQDIKVNILEGYKDLKKMMTHFVNNKSDYYSYGIPKEFPTVLKTWLPWHHKDRIRKKIPIKIIFNEGASDRAQIVNKMELAEAKYFPKEFNAPVTTEISKDEVMIIHWSENPLTIHIKCQEIADSYKRYFDILWETSN